MSRFVFLFAIMANTAYGSGYTIGPHGIDSKSTGLSGSYAPFFGAARIGHAENFRAGKDEYDSPEWSAPNTEPFGVHHGTCCGMDVMNIFVSAHATEVVGVAIGNTDSGATYEGVAPGADLHTLALEDWSDDSLNEILSIVVDEDFC